MLTAVQGLFPSARTHHSLSLRLICSASDWKELHIPLSIKSYVASLILHASIAEITAQLLSLSYV